ncbi:MAG: tetratricopeptide repeat protein [Planctomycetota bacterium]
MTGSAHNPAALAADSAPAAAWAHRLVKLAPFVLVLLSVALYINTLDNDFVFDTTRYLEELETAASPWDTFKPHRPMSRPLPQLTLIANYIFEGGEEPRNYHLVNIAIHAATAVALFFLALQLATAWRRLAHRDDGDEPAPSAAPALLAAGVGLLWVVHPLGTTATAYVIQRHESMMALGFVAALLGVALAARATSAAAIAAWGVFAIAAAFAAVSSKQVAFALPIVAYLMDRCFFERSWIEPIVKRWWLHAGLIAASLWLLVAGYQDAFVEDDANTGVGAGGVQGAIAYLLSQGEVLLTYLRLVVVPAPLVFDYGQGWDPAYPHRPMTWIVSCAIVGAGLIASVVGVLLNRAWGWLGLSVYLILAPSSSVVPIDDLYFEHRMYLPLAAVLALLLLALHGVAQRAANPRAATALCVAATLLMAAPFATLTVLRNAEFATGVTIWATVTQRAPHNPRGWYNVGQHLERVDRVEEAERSYRRAIELDPTHARSLNNLGTILAERGQLEDARVLLERATQTSNIALHHYNLAEVYRQQARLEDAVAKLRDTLEFDPDNAKALNSLGFLLLTRGRVDDGVALIEAAYESDPTLHAARTNLATAYVQTGRWQDAAQLLDTLNARTGRPDEPPRNPTLEMLQARLLAGAPDDAIRDPARALRIMINLRSAGYPEDLRYLEHYAIVAHAAGNRDAALAAIDRAITAATEANRSPQMVAALRDRRRLIAAGEPYRLEPAL